jgi:hypothetical protein
MENLFQLIIAPLLLVTVRTLPLWAKLALPLATTGSVGNAWEFEAKQAATARTSSLVRDLGSQEDLLELAGLVAIFAMVTPYSNCDALILV